MTTKPREDSESQAFEHELQPLREAWTGLGRTEPPEMIDQAVLNAARRELAEATKHRPLKWLGTAATAVVVVLALAIVVQQREQAPLPGQHKSDGFNLERSTSVSATTDETLNRSGEPQAAAGVVSQGFEARRVTDESAAAPPVLAEQPDNEADTGSVLAKELMPQDRDATREDAPGVLAEAVGPTDPEAWIERLLQLRREGREDEFRAELAAFREAWPDHPLPPELGDQGP